MQYVHSSVIKDCSLQGRVGESQELPVNLPEEGMKWPFALDVTVQTFATLCISISEML